MNPEFQSKQTTDIETAARYSEIAVAYNADWRGKNNEVQLVFLREFESLIGPPPKTIFDVGCGTGKDSVHLASQGYSVISLDLSSGMLGKTRENLISANLPAQLILGNMRELCLKDGSIDGIWNMASLVHIPSEAKKRVIGEFHRVLGLGGFLHIGVQNLLTTAHIKRLVQSYFCELGYDDKNQFYQRHKSLKEIASGPSIIERCRTGYASLDRRHWFYPTKFSLIRLLEEQGFTIISSNQTFARRLRIFAQKQP